MLRLWLSACLLLLASCATASPLYLPGTAPAGYQRNQHIPMYMGLVSSPSTAVPYDYFDIPLCPRNSREIVAASQAAAQSSGDTPRSLRLAAGSSSNKAVSSSLGSRLSGSSHEHATSPYDVSVLSTSFCNVLCNRGYTLPQLRRLEGLIRDGYRLNVEIDSLPGYVRYDVSGSAMSFHFTEEDDDPHHPNAEGASRPSRFFVERGAPLGFVDPSTGEVSIFNHLKFVVRYHEDPDSFVGARIVGFEIQPFSVKHNARDKQTVKRPLQDTCDYEPDEKTGVQGGVRGNDPKNLMKIPTSVRGVVSLPGGGTRMLEADGEGKDYDDYYFFYGDEDLEEGEEDASTTSSTRLLRTMPRLPTASRVPRVLDVTFSYDVKWHPSLERWSTRWDIYLLGNPTDEVHIFSIVNSFIVVLFLSALVAIILQRTVNRSIEAYNLQKERKMAAAEATLTDFDQEEEKGWKLVHTDIFRPPDFSPMLLSILVGTGVQVAAVLFSTLTFGAIGIISPLSDGSTLSAAICVYLGSNALSGYSSARLYKFQGGVSWKACTILTATGMPALVGSVFLFMDFWLVNVGAGSTASAGGVVTLVALWIFVSIPLTFFGAYAGFKKDKFEVPVKTNRVPRAIPQQPWYLTTAASAVIGGILPFGSISIELFFVLSALWLHQIYYVFGFLLVSCILLCITCVEISILFTYLRACSEDYRWMWQSFLTTASTGFYLFLYSVWYMNTTLHLHDHTSRAVYITYMGVVSGLIGMMCGMVGVYSSFWFLKVIYGAVKVD